MTRSRPGALASVALLAVVWLQAAPAGAVGEQAGRLRGRVIDAASREGMPSATVSVRSPSLIGGAREVTTDDSGRFDIDNLPPGLYRVEVSYPGILPVVRTAVVGVGVVTPLNVVWSSQAAGMDTVAVVEKRPLTRADSTQTGSTLDSDLLNDLPSGRNYQTSAQLLPGVSGGANPSVRGGLDLNNRFLFDGLDVTDPVTGTFSTNLSFDSVQAVDVLTGGLEAQYNSLGGVINVLTRRGSGDFHALASFYVNHNKLSSSDWNPNYGLKLYEGYQPFNDDPGAPTQSYAFSFVAGGPVPYLLKDKLWYNIGYEFRYGETSTPKLAPLGAAPYYVQHPSAPSTQHYLRGHLTFAPTSAHRITLSGGISPGVFNNSNGGNFLLGVAETRQNQNSIWTIGAWDWYISQVATATVQAGYYSGYVETGPQGLLGSIDTSGCDLFTIKDNCHWIADRPRHVNQVDQTAWYQGPVYSMDKRQRLQVDPSVSFKGKLFGSHDVKIGVQSQYVRRTRDLKIPGDQVFTDDGGGPLEGGLCDPSLPNPVGCFQRTDTPPYSYAETGLGAGLYLQDRWWTPLTWLTVTPGIRVDHGVSWDRHNRQVTSLTAVGPRLGLSADVTRDARNVVFAYYGRHTEVLSLLPGSNADGLEAQVSVTRRWVPADKDFTGIVNQVGGEGTVTVDPHATAPHKDEITAGVRHELTPTMLAGAEYTFNRISNLWANEPNNRVWDPSGYRVVSWADPNRWKQDTFYISTPDANYRIYHGAEIYLEGHPTPVSYLSTSYNLSWTYGPANTVFAQNSAAGPFTNPRQTRFYDGFQLTDIRHYLRAFGTYTFFGHLTIGGTFGYFSGLPLTKSYVNNQNGNPNYRSPLGTVPSSPNDTKSISEFRLPDRTTIDLRLQYNFLPVRVGQKLNLIVDVFNAFTSRVATAIATNDNANFGDITARQGPTRIQLALEYVY